MYPAHPRATGDPGAKSELVHSVEPLDRRVLGLAGVLAGGAVLAAVNGLSGGRIGLPCPFHAVTGLNCPFCGTTRMAAALLEGDVVRAWWYNPPMFVVLPIVALLVGYMLLTWTAERLGWFRLPRPRPGDRLQRIVPLAFLGVMAVYGILRNLF
ncbi:uncharacterized protein DUF2752 [Kribbella amoyensis]|uniref:Uncharacterized protein DUF2752 n=1 Tax=Kribbella amoyensis TaxID=996641 RepID=A0A561BRS6_9ACTN|nr:DUF2752 domain-containing protein [Kribbella amoyensis]TWD81509.1 uncharacterized protein DUF2752 [Kribbella amoyensis]